MVYIANQDRDLVFIDSETSGLTAGYNEAIEWAAIRRNPKGEEIKVFEAKVKPSFMDRFDAKAKEVNGFTEEAWADAPDEFVTAMEMQKICQDAILVGQNVSFDEGFLTAFLKKHDRATTWHYHKIDTMVLAWPLIKKGVIDGLSLVNLCKWVGIEQPKPHRAMSDARAVIAVYDKLMEVYSSALDAKRDAGINPMS